MKKSCQPMFRRHLSFPFHRSCYIYSPCCAFQAGNLKQQEFQQKSRKPEPSQSVPSQRKLVDISEELLERVAPHDTQWGPIRSMTPSRTLTNGLVETPTDLKGNGPVLPSHPKTHSGKSEELSVWATVMHFGHHLWPRDRWDLRLRLAAAMGCVLGTKILKVYVPVVFKHLIDSLVVAKETAEMAGLATVPLMMPGHGITSPTMAYLATLVNVPALGQSIIALVLAYGLARLTSSLLQEAAPMFFSRIGTTAANEVNLDVFRKLHALDLHFHIGKAPGGVAKEMDRSTRAFGDLARATLFVLVPTIAELALASYVLYTHAGVTMAGAALGSVGIFLLFTMGAAKYRSRFPRRYNQQDARLGKIVVDSLVNYETVKLFGNEAFEFARVKRINNHINHTVECIDASMSALRFGQQAIAALTLTGCLLYSTSLIAAGSMTIGNIVLIDTLLIQLFTPLTTIGKVYREAYGASINMQAAVRLFQLPCDDGPEDIKEGNPKAFMQPLRSFSPSSYSIVFDKVSFSYDGHTPVLQDISLKIAGGATVAFVGPSGCGKSTILRLLYRFISPTGGTIAVDGQDICSVSKDSYRPYVGVVPQDLLLFNDTIRFNIRYGNLNASDAEVEAAAKAAHIHAVVMRMPLGYDTIVGDRGLRMSGGEKQRLAIARVLLKRSPILLADESTSALDSVTESNIMRLLTSASKGAAEGRQLPSDIVTTVLIAHRLSTIRDVHCIFVLTADGRLAEQGRHEELLAKRGQYAQMWAEQHMQSFSDKEDPYHAEEEEEDD